MVFYTRTSRIIKNLRDLCFLYVAILCLTIAQKVVSFGMTRTTPWRPASLTTSNQKSKVEPATFSPKRFPLFFSRPSDEENTGHEESEKQWDREESLLVMNLSPSPSVSSEESLSRISQYIRSFPFAAVLPVQPLQALPTDDGGLELKFLRKKTHIKSGVDGGVRFFVHFRDSQNDSIEVLVKRNSDGQSIPKMFAEKLIVQSFAKGMALGSDHGNEDGKDERATIKVPATRIESPTKDMAKIQSIFHKWM